MAPEDRRESSADRLSAEKSPFVRDTGAAVHASDCPRSCQSGGKFEAAGHANFCPDV